MNTRARPRGGGGVEGWPPVTEKSSKKKSIWYNIYQYRK